MKIAQQISYIYNFIHTYKSHVNLSLLSFPSLSVFGATGRDSQGSYSRENSICSTTQLQFPFQASLSKGYTEFEFLDVVISGIR